MDSRSGGKIVTNKRKRYAVGPYDRPQQQQPPAPAAEEEEERFLKSPNWLTGHVFPATRTILSGAAKILTSVFNSDSSSSSSSGSDSMFEDDDREENDICSEVDELKKHPQLRGERSQTKHLIEQLLMQETFSREERDQLVTIINSRVMDSSSLEGKDSLERLDHSSQAIIEARKWLEEKRDGLRPDNTIGGVSSVVGVDDTLGSPVEMAKSYMKVRPPWASPSVDNSGLREEALVRVFERVIEVTAENNGLVLGVENVVSCRLLVKGNQVGALMGKGGKVIDTIRRENGCRIKVLTSGKMPSCASPNDEIVEIEGDILAVKKALVAVSRRLQDCFSVERTRTVENAPIELDSEKTLPPEPVDLPAQRSSLSQPITTSSFSGASGCHPVPLDADKFSSSDSKMPLQEVAFRILCTNDKVGAIIGKAGTIVRALQNDSGASIAVGPNVAECNERMITITALENLELRKSPAQTAVVLVFDRILDAGSGMNLGTRSLITFRLVVANSQVGCLLGKGGAIISDIRKETGTSIRIFRGDQVPKCVSDNDEVVQIAGEFVNVQDALRNVTGRLRDNLLAVKVSNGGVSRNSSPLTSESSPSGQMREPPFGFHRSSGVSHGNNQHPELTRSINNLVLSNKTDHPPSPGLWSSQTRPGVNQRGAFDVSKGSNSVKGGIELGSGSRSAIVTNTTVKIMVPENIIGCVYGEDGSNLTRLRQISGARVMVHEPRPGTTDRIIVISGTPDETQAAQSLLQAFILTE